MDESHCDVGLSLSFSIIVWSCCGGQRVNTDERHDWWEVLLILLKLSYHINVVLFFISGT